MHSEAALGVVDKAEVLACLFDRDDVHKTGWVCRIGANLSVDFDKALHDDGFGFAGVEGILESSRKSERLATSTTNRELGFVKLTDFE